MKNARVVTTEEVGSLTPDSLTRHIIGKDPAERFDTTQARPDEAVVLSLVGVSDEILTDVTFDLYKGEILGIAGLGGSGRTNIAEVMFGARQPTTGRVLLDGEEVRLDHPEAAVSRGIGLVTEDRQADGFLPKSPVWQNVTLPWRSHFSRLGIMRLGRERATAHDAVERFDIRTRSIRTPMRELSGGNQQKTILATWLARPLKVLVLDEPTHGVDVGAKEEVYRLIHDVADQGVSILMISSELSELEGLCHRVLVIVEGRIVDQLVGDDITEANMLGSLFEEPSRR